MIAIVPAGAEHLDGWAMLRHVLWDELSVAEHRAEAEERVGGHRAGEAPMRVLQLGREQRELGKGFAGSGGFREERFEFDDLGVSQGVVTQFLRQLCEPVLIRRRETGGRFTHGCAARSLDVTQANRRTWSRASAL